jgi:hypothetical protein
MDIETLIATADPARHTPPGDPDSPEAAAIYQRITARPARRRRAIITVATVSVAAGLAAGVLLTVPGAGQVDHAPGTATLTAKQLLGRAADAALVQPAAIPRPDQFLYLKVETSGSGPSNGISRYWNSIDGTHNGLSMITPSTTLSEIPGCRHGRQVFTGMRRFKRTGPNTVSEPCTPAPAYLSALPTNPHKLLSYLERGASPHVSLAYNIFESADSLLLSDYLLPAQRAAVYEVLSTTSGITVVPHVTDIAGRAGVGVECFDRGSPVVLIFDSRNYAYLGMRFPGGGQALLSSAIVDRAGQLP